MNRTDDSPEHQEASQRLEASLLAARSPLPASSFAPAFHSDDVEHLANYRSLSVSALISLLIGLTSPLCLLSKLFLPLPLIGVAVSLLALRRISLSEGRLAGRWVATVGLALCVAFGSTAIARSSVNRYMRESQAKSFATNWLKLVASNDAEQAFKVTYDGVRPLTPSEPGAPPAPTKSPFEMFVDTPLIQKITQAGKDAAIELEGTLEFTPQTRREAIVRQKYLVTPAGDSSSEPVEVYLTLQRSKFRGDANLRWLVIRFDPTDAPRK